MPQSIINSFLSSTGPVFPGPTPDFWVDASQITGLSDLDPVSSWLDASGNSRDFTQATAANQPAYRTNQLNGMPSVKFTTNDYLSAANLPSGNTSYTMFFVMRDGSDITQFAFYWGTATNGFGIGIISPTRAVQHRNSGVTVNCIDGTYTTTIGEAWTMRRNSVGPLLEFWTNGVSEVITNDSSALGAVSSAGVLGAFNPASPSVFWSGDVFELIGYASVLTDPQRVAIESYLIAKYGL